MATDPGPWQSVGWVATAVFTASYWFRRADLLRAVQMVGALLWIVYGLAIEARPVILANVLLLAAATLAALRSRAVAPPDAPDRAPPTGER